MLDAYPGRQIDTALFWHFADQIFGSRHAFSLTSILSDTFSTTYSTSYPGAAQKFEPADSPSAKRYTTLQLDSRIQTHLAAEK